MNQTKLSECRLPRFNEIPNVGLYLKQVVTFINEVTEPMLHTTTTTTMLSNYVKLHLVSNPVKKMYNREQIAVLIFIVLVKNVLSLDNIRKTLVLQQQTADVETAYNYFCDRFEAVLRQVSGDEVIVVHKEELPVEQYLLNHIIITLVQKLYMDEGFRGLADSEDSE